MHINILVNGTVSLVLSPDNEMEEEVLKALCKQDNAINEIRQSINVVNTTLSKGIIISSKITNKVEQD